MKKKKSKGKIYETVSESSAWPWWWPSLEFGNHKSNIYDYNESAYPQISGNVNAHEAKLYDYQRSAVFEGRRYRPGI